MSVPSLDDADRRFLERVAEDCQELLGGQIELRELSISRDDMTVIRARYRLAEEEATTEGRGESLIEAHAGLREQLVVDRIRLGAQALIQRR
jgi:hypothetical protein